MSDEFSAWQQEASADEVTVHVCLNRRLYRQFMDAADRLEQVKLSSGQSKLDGPDDDQLTELMERVAELERQVSEAERPMVFATIPPSRRRALEEAHPATEAQKESDPKATVNEDTYWPAVLAECCVSPGLSVEQARWLRDGDDGWPGLPENKWNELVVAVSRANVEGSNIPKSVRSTVRTLSRELNSIMQQSGESLSLSSEDGS